MPCVVAYVETHHSCSVSPIFTAAIQFFLLLHNSLVVLSFLLNLFPSHQVGCNDQRPLPSSRYFILLPIFAAPQVKFVLIDHTQEKCDKAKACMPERVAMTACVNAANFQEVSCRVAPVGINASCV